MMLDILITIGTAILAVCLIYLGLLPRMLERKKEKVTMTTDEEESFLNVRKKITYVVIIVAAIMVAVPFGILYFPMLF